MYKLKKNITSSEEKINYREISIINDQFQIFRLNSKILRELFIVHGEQIRRWENDNSSMKYLEENKFQE